MLADLVSWNFLPPCTKKQSTVCTNPPTCFVFVVETPTQIEPTKYVISIERAARIHHMVVFLLPNGMFLQVRHYIANKNRCVAVIDPTMAASVYFQLPGKEFQLLGA